MKKILLMRHAKSSWDNPGLADHSRPLADRGVREARQMGNLLKEKNLLPEKLICSTAVRTSETAAIVQKALNHEPQIVRENELYSASPEVYYQVIRQLSEQVELPMLVGHNPAISAFVGLSCRTSVHMKTSYTAEIHFDIPRWDQLDEQTVGKLANFWERPKKPKT